VNPHQTEVARWHSRALLQWGVGGGSRLHAQDQQCTQEGQEDGFCWVWGFYFAWFPPACWLARSDKWLKHSWQPLDGKRVRCGLDCRREATEDKFLLLKMWPDVLDLYQCLQCNSFFQVCSHAAGGWLLGADEKLSTLAACSKCRGVLSTLQGWASMRRDACQLCVCVPRTSLCFLLHHCRLESRSTWSSADSFQILNSCQFYSSRAT